MLTSEIDYSLLLKREKVILKKYHEVLINRAEEWYWPQDGEFLTPNIYFLSNISGLEKQVYFNQLIPRLKQLHDFEGFVHEIGIGSCDSFLERSPKKVEVVLKSLLADYPREISFAYKDGQTIIDTHIVGGYFKNGTLPFSNDPCNSIITARATSNAEILSELELLINRHHKECELEAFITRYYQEIFGHKYDRIETQLWLKFPDLDINHKTRRTDIFLRNAVTHDWELQELKSTKRITRNYRGLPVLSAEISGALTQLKNYEHILRQDSVRRLFAKQGLEYFEPELRLVIGGKPEISLPQWRRLQRENENGLKITTGDELVREMRVRMSDYLSLTDTV